MTATSLTTVVRHLHALIAGHGTELSDGHLLEAFAKTGDARAFEGLVPARPPGRGSLSAYPADRLAADRDDVFQATFLVLARKAGSIRKQASVGSWLFGVARAGDAPQMPEGQATCAGNWI